MTDSTMGVREALSRIVADEPDDSIDPGILDAMWRAGSRRRWRARAGVGAALAVVGLLVAGALAPLQAPSAALVPATPSGAALPSYPEHVAMPLRPPRTSTPGRAALGLPGTQGTSAGAFAVGPGGSVAFVPLSGASDTLALGGAPGSALAVSPDGREIATASAVLDLTTGASMAVALHRSDPGELWRGAPWWGPDSHRVLYPALPSLTGSEGLVVDVRGTTQVLPPAGVGDALLLAGWKDDATVIGLWRHSADEFTVLTWTLGDTGWTNGATVSWPGWEDDPPAAASVSPDGSRLLLLRSVDGTATGAGQGTQAQVFDTGSGALVGFPVGDVPASEAGWTPGSYLSWEGFGCRPAWRGDVPVITDGGVRLANGPAGTELMSISSAFGQGSCPSFAGNELQGEPVSNLGAVWLERLRTWGLPLAVLVLAGLVTWWLGRRQNWREHPKPLPAIFPTFGR